MQLIRRRKPRRPDLLNVPEVVYAVQAIKRTNNVLEAWKAGAASENDVAKTLAEGERAADQALEVLRKLHH